MGVHDGITLMEAAVNTAGVQRNASKLHTRSKFSEPGLIWLIKI